MSRWVRVWILIVVLAAIFVFSRHVIGKSSTTTTTTSTTTTSAPASTTTTTAVASDTCDATGFTGVYNEGEGAAGTIYATVTLTKTSDGTCTLEGWPLLTLQDRQGGIVTSRLVDVPGAGVSFHFLTPAANHAPKPLSLTQDQSITFALAYSDVSTGATACPSAASLSVQFVASGATVPLTAPYALQPCNGGQLWVSPFY